jgi:tetratricopeptide (TPR) repeat protein
MYLSGSKWNTKRKRRRSSPWRILLLILLIAAAIYIERFVVPTVPPLFVVSPTPTRSPATFVLEAESLAQSGKLAQAADAYRQAIAIDPQEAAYYIELARVQVLSGDYDEAVISARNALLLDPNSAMANGVLAWSLVFQGPDSFIEAREKAERALDLDPDSPLVLSYYAEVLIDNDLESYETALDHAQRAMQLDPNLMEAHRALGYVWERTGNYAEAQASYESALRINPNLSLLYLSLGNMHFNQGETEAAIDSYLNAISLAPTDVTPLRLLAQLYARIGEFGKASQYAAGAVSLEPHNARLHGDLGRMLFKNQQFAPSIDEFTLAIRGGQTPSKWIINSQTIEVTDQTSIDPDLGIGSAVVALVTTRPDGTYVASEIVPEAEAAPGGSPEFLRIPGIVEEISPGVFVSPLPLDPGDSRVVEFYYTYGLALANVTECELAVQIAEALLAGVPENEFAVFNAEEMLIICGLLEPRPILEGEG